ncbi:MAG TPA: hypothetical protein VK061_06605 [Bacillota bacterium]|nr:hypothetical protein [Bacillota bacterium]
MAVYLFTGAAVLSIIPLIFIFKINAEKLAEEPDNFNEIQKRFFISVLVSKVIPALLIIMGITQMKDVPVDQLIIPWLIILFSLVYGIYYIVSFKRRPFEGKPKIAVDTFVNLAIPFIFSIPLMSAVFMFLMME